MFRASRTNIVMFPKNEMIHAFSLNFCFDASVA
ncbi:MAG: hypothetical protein JWR22_901 [Herminiimonas sp.]|nr:hypothetical protein [Herminiimonas sp.]